MIKEPITDYSSQSWISNYFSPSRFCRLFAIILSGLVDWFPSFHLVLKIALHHSTWFSRLFPSCHVVQLIVFHHAMWFRTLFSIMPCGLVDCFRSCHVVQLIVFQHAMWFSRLFSIMPSGLVDCFPSCHVVQLIVFHHAMWFSRLFSIFPCSYRYIVVQSRLVNSLVVTGIQWSNIRQSTHWQLPVYSIQRPDSQLIGCYRYVVVKYQIVNSYLILYVYSST